MSATKTEEPARQWQIHFSLPTREDIRGVFKPPVEEKRRRWRLFKSYIVDWVIVIIINIGGGLFGILGPRHREFSLHDRSIQYTPHDSYVPDFVPPLVGYAAPVLSAVVFLIIRRRNWHDFHCAVLGIFLAMGLNNIATNVLKNACGRPRPDFIARCNPSIDKDPPLKLVDYTVCQQTDLSYLHEGMRSFPSGHASLSFCGLTFTALYLASHFRYNDQRGHAYKTLVFYVPLFCAALIAVSRTADYHHHWSDVLAGSIMGCYIGWFGYRTYFPPVFDPTVLSDRPYPRRIPKPANLAHIGYRSGHLLPVDEDPYQVGSSGHSSSLQLTRPHASHVQLAVPEQSTAIQVDPDNQVPAITTVPPGSSYVNVARASHQVAHEEGEAEPKPVQPAAGNL